MNSDDLSRTVPRPRETVMALLRKKLLKAAWSISSGGGARGKLSILLFHKIPLRADPLTPSELCLPEFEQILDLLRESANVLPLQDALRRLAQRTLPPRATVITFDDGYVEWLQNVSPALLKRRLPATFFVTTEQLSGVALWHERVIAAVRALPDRGAELPYGYAQYSQLPTLARRIALIDSLLVRLKYSPLSERIKTIEAIEAQRCHELELPPRFTAEMVRALHEQGFEIGAHTRRHPILNECSLSEAEDEIRGAKGELERIIGATVCSFAYPNGRPGRDYSREHVEIVRRAGYTCAVVTGGGVSRAGVDPLQLPRFTPWASKPWRVAAQLVRNASQSEAVAVPHSTAEVASPLRLMMLASTFPPIHGGSAVVYESLCRQMPRGSVRVLTARRHFQTRQEVANWLATDDGAPYPVDRIDFLRPPYSSPPRNLVHSALRLLFVDMPVYARLLLSASLIVRRHNINVVCVGELITGTWVGLALRRLFGCRVVVYVHGEEITTTSAGRLHGNRRRYYLSQVDHVVAVSSFTCEVLTRDFGLPPVAVTLIENGVDTDRFTPAPPDRVLQLKHGLEGCQTVLTVGRLVPRKGMDMAIRAMAEVARERSDVRYLIVGDGEYRSALQEIINELKLGAVVTLVGTATDDELLAYFRTCDVFLMPNRTMPDGDTEGFGLVFREANACGKPVIGGRAGGAVEAVLDGVTGLLVDGEQPSEIARAVLRLVSDRDLAARLGRQGLLVATERNTRNMASRFCDVCEREIRKVKPGESELAVYWN